MWTRQHKPRRTGRLIIPAVTVLFVGYFGYHVYHGEFGINSRAVLEARASELQVELDTVRAQRTALEKRVKLLQDGTLERDMLDEQARRALNVSHPGELTVMFYGDNAGD